MSDHSDLRHKIVKALNEEIGSDLKQLYKLKELYDETIEIQNNLKEKVWGHAYLFKNWEQTSISF